MFFNSYIQILTESFSQEERNLTVEMKKYQSKIINLQKQINIQKYQEVYPKNTEDLKGLLVEAAQEYKNFINSHLDTILKYPELETMYKAFADVLKSLKI